MTPLLALKLLSCSYSDSHFRVTDGTRTWEKYIGNWDNKVVKIECGEKIGAALIGSYFVFFDSGNIRSLYVGSFKEDRRVLTLSHDVVAAIEGSHFITARAGGDIVNYYVGRSDDSKIVAGDGMAAALMGLTFVAHDSGVTRERFVGSRSANDVLIQKGSLIAAIMGSSLVVFDKTRGRIVERRTGSVGTLEIQDGVVIFQRESDGSTIRYDVSTGEFSEEDFYIH